MGASIGCGCRNLPLRLDRRAAPPDKNAKPRRHRDHERKRQVENIQRHESGEDQRLVGQGKCSVDGKEERYVLVQEKLSRDGDPTLVLYVRAGVLFLNDKSKSSNPDKAPDYTGPLDHYPRKRIAGWKGEKDDRKYVSLKVSDKTGGSGGDPTGEDQPKPKNDPFDDEIPF